MSRPKHSRNPRPLGRGGCQGVIVSKPKPIKKFGSMIQAINYLEIERGLKKKDGVYTLEVNESCTKNFKIVKGA